MLQVWLAATWLLTRICKLMLLPSWKKCSSKKQLCNLCVCVFCRFFFNDPSFTAMQTDSFLMPFNQHDRLDVRRGRELSEPPPVSSHLLPSSPPVLLHHCEGCKGSGACSISSKVAEHLKSPDTGRKVISGEIA